MARRNLIFKNTCMESKRHVWGSYTRLRRPRRRNRQPIRRLKNSLQWRHGRRRKFPFPLPLIPLAQLINSCSAPPPGTPPPALPRTPTPSAPAPAPVARRPPTTHPLPVHPPTSKPPRPNIHSINNRTPTIPAPTMLPPPEKTSTPHQRHQDTRTHLRQWHSRRLRPNLAGMRLMRRHRIAGSRRHLLGMGMGRERKGGQGMRREPRVRRKRNRARTKWEALVVALLCEGNGRVLGL